MTEFVIGAAFVAVPLFLIVPTVAKYIDMRQASVSAARYAAWEFTAHYGSPGDQPGGFTGYNAMQMPVKTLAQVNREAERRFFSDTAIPIATFTDRAGYQPANANPLWTYHNGLPIYQPQAISSVNAAGPGNTPDPLVIARGAVNVFGGIARLIAGLLQGIGVQAGFDAINTQGRFSASVSLPVQPAPNYGFDSAVGLAGGGTNGLFGQGQPNINMRANAAVIGLSWSAGGPAHTVFQSGGLVPTALLDQALNGFGIPLQQIASTILISPELGPNSLIFGYPTGPRGNPQVMDNVPPDKLVGSTLTTQCNPGGYCENR